MKSLESWFLTVFAGKILARLAVTIAGVLAAGPIHNGLASVGVSVNIDQTAFAAGTIALAQAGFEWYKKARVVPAAMQVPTVTPKP